MLDESFHLTPLDVRRTDFPAALRGYDKARVDEFRDRVANELERLTRVNQELEAKAKGFHEQLRAFRERDKALNEALVSAQQLRAETREQAEREAQLIIREARAEGVRQEDAARADVRRLAAEIESLERARRAYLAQLRAMVSRQLAELDAIPDSTAGTAGGGSGGGSGDQGASGSNTGSRGTAAGSAGETRDTAANSPSHLPPPPSAPIAPPLNGADADRAPSLTPAWLKAVPAE
ncbi:MAG: DivIVA domain-containing protein [Gemmatimonadales bacterium]|jgi:DivIVA domain-containing protein